jgi:hypothetical protein
LIFPLMLWVILHTHCLPNIGLKVKLNGEKVIFGVNAPIITKRQWFINRWVSDRSPKIDYLETTFEKIVSLLGKVAPDTSDRSSRGLIYVCQGCRLPAAGRFLFFWAAKAMSY